ncbi:peroxiredoxin family protein [Niabella hibiscisoli]|uniref:peroxiredoxin family protein n=1 Tax=Niabella hibiscisoli TaxID=1825928 RepID=UPI001F0FC4E9|nr:peroxiredoxin family protein [Niabella hibiscisoli]MCH5721146.1 peroxiredoxin family protein [Niabella hibiscisoli]
MAILLLFEKLSDDIKTHLMVKIFKIFQPKSKREKVGNKYIDFGQPNAKNEHQQLSKFKGKIVLLEFGGPGVCPVGKGHVELIAIYNEYNQKGFEILEGCSRH